MMIERRIIEQSGQEFTRAVMGEVFIGDCVWIREFNGYANNSRLKGPYFVIDISSLGTLNEYLVIHSTHLQEEMKINYQDVYIPIIDTIVPPRGHNA